jgi:hypothetical protein
MTIGGFTMSAFLRVVLLSLALAGCGGSDDPPAPPPPPTPDPVTRTVLMAGVQEVPAVASPATGKGSLTLDRATGALTGSVTLDGMTATSAHIHDGAAGANGGVIVTLAETSAGVWSVPANTVLNAAQIASFGSGGLYVNAHSAANAGGEIRGQIGMEVYAASLSGKQGVPANASTASGAGSVVLDPATRMLTGGFTLTGMTATMAHIHSGAAGSNGGVVVTLAESPAGSGKWMVPASTTLTEAQVTALRAGELYFNAHSSAAPSGEVRGQIGRHVRTATLSGGHEVPSNTSTASGTGFLAVDPFTRAASGSITIAGIAPTMAHIHTGAHGSNGGVAVTLVQGASPNTWRVPDNTTLTAAQYADFLKNNLYYNVHSAAFPGGEIRGQLDDDAHHAH